MVIPATEGTLERTKDTITHEQEGEPGHSMSDIT